MAERGGVLVAIVGRQVVVGFRATVVVAVLLCAGAVGAAPAGAAEVTAAVDVVDVSGTFAAGESGTVAGACPAGMQVIGGAIWVGTPADPFASTRVFAPTPDNRGWSETFADDTGPWTLTTRGYCSGEVPVPAPPLQFRSVEVSGTFAAGEPGAVSGRCPDGTEVYGGSVWIGTPADPFASTRVFAPTPDNLGWAETFPAGEEPMTITTRGSCIGETDAGPSLRVEIVDSSATFATGGPGAVTGRCPDATQVSDGTTWVGSPADPFASTRVFAPTPDNAGWDETFVQEEPFTLSTRVVCIGAAAPTPPTTTSTAPSSTVSSVPAPTTVSPPAAAVVVAPVFTG